MGHESNKQIRLLMVEPRGVRGINQYTHLLCNAMSRHAEVTMATIPNYEMSDRERLYHAEFLFHRTRSYPLDFSKLMSYIRTTRPDIVHYQGFFYWPADMLFFRLLARSGAKLVVTSHDVLPHSVKWFHYAAMSALYRPVDHIIVHDRYCCGLLSEKLRVNQDNVSIVPHGNFALFGDAGDTDRVQSRTRLGIPQNAKVVLYFGVITERKGVQDLIRAFGEVRKALPEAYLVIAGMPHGVNWSEYTDLISEQQIGDRTLSIPKHVPFDEVKHLFVASDVVCLPYHSVYQSGVLQAAYGFSRPVVATTVGGLPDVVEDGATGYLVPPHSPDAIAKALVSILRDGDLANTMMRRIQYLVATKYSWEAIADQTIKVYDRILGRPACPQESK